MISKINKIESNTEKSIKSTNNSTITKVTNKIKNNNEIRTTPTKIMT